MSNNHKKESSNIFLKYWFPAILWAVIIFIFSSYPTVRASEIHWKDFFVKKSVHIIEYGVFTILLYRAFRKSGIDKKKAGIYSILISVLYGVSDEVHQSFTPGRESKLRDIMFDAIGSIFAVYFVWRILPLLPKRLRVIALKFEVN